MVLLLQGYAGTTDEMYGSKGSPSPRTKQPQHRLIPISHDNGSDPRWGSLGLGIRPGEWYMLLM